jgi:uncharacterized membrane protein YfcA
LTLLVLDRYLVKLVGFFGLPKRWRIWSSGFLKHRQGVHNFMLDFLYESSRFLIGLVIGIALGMTGGGGSLLLPTFTYLFGFPVQVATGYTLILTGAAATVGVISRVRKGTIDYATGITLALPVLAGTLMVRGWLFAIVPPVLLEVGDLQLSKRTFVMLIFAAIVLLSWATMIGLIGNRLTPNPNLRSQQPARYFAILIGCGFVIGILSAFIGAGGGVMLVPLMVIVMGLPMRTVVGTTLLIVAVKSTIGFAGDLWSQAAAIDVWFLVQFFAVMVVGVLVGSSVSSRIPPSVLKRGFAWFLLFIAAFVMVKEMFL